MTDGPATFLTAEEVWFLTGYRRYGSQIAWLVRNNVHHYVARSGRPIVPSSAVNAPRAKTEPPIDRFADERANLLRRLQQTWDNQAATRPRTRKEERMEFHRQLAAKKAKGAG